MTVERRLGTITAHSPPYVSVGGATAVPCVVLGRYVPLVGEHVWVLETVGSPPLVLGPSGWGAVPPSGPMVLAHLGNNVGSGTFASGETVIPLTALLDVMAAFNDGADTYVLPWDGYYRYHAFTPLTIAANIGYYMGLQSTSFAWRTINGAVSPITMSYPLQATSPPLFDTAGTGLRLVVGTTAAAGSLAAGFGRNTEVVIEWLGEAGYPR